MDPTLQLIINIGAMCTALAALVGLPVAVVKLWPLIKRAVAIGATAEKLPEMAAEIKTLAVTLTAQNEVLDRIVNDVNKAVQQVQNSHVTNLRDDLDEVIGKMDGLHDKFDEHLDQCQPAAPTTTINVNPGSTQ